MSNPENVRIHFLSNPENENQKMSESENVMSELENVTIFQN